MANSETSSGLQWYVLRVQSGRENTVAESIRKRVKARGLEAHVGEVLVPTEKVYEVKGGTKRVSNRKLYPGYVYIQMEINEATWFLVRETPGVGDFVGTPNKPMPLPPEEIAKIKRELVAEEGEPKIRISFKEGDRVKVKEGTFENFDGVVEEVTQKTDKDNKPVVIVKVIISIFGRSTPVELEHWKLESV